MQARRSLGIGVAALAASLLAQPPGAVAQAEAAPEVPLERLLKLPEAVATTPSPELRRGGKTRAEWQERFAKAQAELAKARQSLEDSRKELDEIAPDQAWSMGAPGLPSQSTPSETSVDFRLRQQIRRQRDELEHAEQRLQELSVEANLAGVPDDWRGSAAEAKTSEARSPSASD